MKVFRSSVANWLKSIWVSWDFENSRFKACWIRVSRTCRSAFSWASHSLCIATPKSPSLTRRATWLSSSEKPAALRASRSLAKVGHWLGPERTGGAGGGSPASCEVGQGLGGELRPPWPLGLWTPLHQKLGTPLPLPVTLDSLWESVGDLLGHPPGSHHRPRCRLHWVIFTSWKCWSSRRIDMIR